jgi:hypothetical protein
MAGGEEQWMADGMDSYLWQARKADEYGGLLEESLTTLSDGDGEAFKRFLSPNLIARVGAEAVDTVVQQQLLPFFAGCQGFGDRTTVAHATDSDGNEGLSFYKTAIGADSAERPFVIYIVEEAGRPVVANLLVNTTYEDMHGGQSPAEAS